MLIKQTYELKVNLIIYSITALESAFKRQKLLKMAISNVQYLNKNMQYLKRTYYIICLYLFIFGEGGRKLKMLTIKI